ncbi:MAG: hypothetical protein AAGF31_03210 [Planctomycetota bacterium]
MKSPSILAMLLLLTLVTGCNRDKACNSAPRYSRRGNTTMRRSRQRAIN